MEIEIILFAIGSRKNKIVLMEVKIVKCFIHKNASIKMNYVWHFFKF